MKSLFLDADMAITFSAVKNTIEVKIKINIVLGNDS